MTRIKLKFAIVGKNWDPTKFSLLFENIVQKTFISLKMERTLNRFTQKVILKRSIQDS